jgi:hypothetical protein
MVLGREQSDVSFQVTINTPIHQSANQYPQCLEPTCQSCGRQQPSNKCHRLRSLLRHLELRSRQRRHRILEHQILLQQLATNHRSKLQFLHLPCVQLQPHRPFMDPSSRPDAQSSRLPEHARHVRWCGWRCHQLVERR